MYEEKVFPSQLEQRILMFIIYYLFLFLLLLLLVVLIIDSDIHMEPCNSCSTVAS